jgi:hypothetical protein
MPIPDRSGKADAGGRAFLARRRDGEIAETGFKVNREDFYFVAGK